MSLKLGRENARSKKRLSISLLLLAATMMFVMVLLSVSNPVYAIPQKTLTFSYSISGGGSGYNAPTLSITVNGHPTNVTLTGTPTAYLADVGTPWSVTNPLTHSDPAEHWQTSETTSGTVSTDLTIAFTYYNQYLVTFDASSNVKGDSTATIVTVAGATMTTADLPFSGWFNSGSSLSYAYSSPITSAGSPTDTQYRWNSTSGLSQTLQSNTFTVSGAGTVTGTYVAQYKVTFAQSGLTSDASGTVVTVDSVDKAYGDLPFTTDWIDSGSSVTYSYSSPVASTGSPTDTQYRWASTSGLDTLQTDTLTVSGAGTVTGNYATQYKVSFDVSINVKTDSSETIMTVGGVAKTTADLPFTTAWINSGSSLTWAFLSPVASTASPSDTQYRWNSTSGLGQSGQSGSLTVTAPGTVTGTYVTQYLVTFDESGLGSDASGTVITVFGDAKTFSELPNNTWVDSGTDVSFSYSSIVGVDAGKQYVLTGVSGNTTASSVTVSNAVTVTGAYKTQYLVSFIQSGSSVAPTVTYTADTDPTTAVPFTVWVKAGTSITFAYQTTVSGTTGVQYVLTGTNATSPQTVNAPLTVLGSYLTQYYLTVDDGGHGTVGGQGWYDADTDTQASMTPLTVAGTTGTQYVFAGWSGDATGSGSPSNNILMDGPKTATATWTTQYYLTVNSAYDSPSPSSGWFDSGSSITESVSSPVSGGPGTQYVCTGWSGFGSVPVSGSGPSVAFAITAPSSITWNWKTQYQLSFHESGLDSDAGSNTVLTVGSTSYAFSSFAVDNVWVDSGTTFTWESTVSGGSGKQFVKTGESGLTSPITTSGTSTATYKTQYWIVFRQEGVGGDYSAADVMTVNTVSYDGAGTAFWADSDDLENFTYSTSLLVALDEKQYVLTGINASTGFTVSGFETVTGTYKTQYWIVFGTSGVGNDYSAADVFTVNGTGYDRFGTAFWADDGSA